VPAVQPFRLERYFARYEFAVRHLLCSSDGETMSVRELLAFAGVDPAALLDTSLGYTQSAGHPALREAIAGLYPGLGHDEVLVHAGAEEAIYGFFRAVLRPGERVVVQAPCYQSLAEVARAQGCEVVEWRMREGAAWSLALEDLVPLLAPGAAAVVVNSPHNPTGWSMPPAMQRELFELSRRHGFRVFSDEVYRGLEPDGAPRLPAACELDARAVSLGVMSKTYGLAGLRIGWVATHDPAVLAAMAAYKDFTSICNAAPSETLALAALSRAEALAARQRATIAGNVALLAELAARRPGLFEGAVPQAGPISFPRFRPGLDAEEACHRLAERAGVLLLPGALFGPPWSDRVRVGFGRRSFPAALRALEAALDADVLA
jgi:aspartate/methionine/tyrosine aminotransferase